MRLSTWIGVVGRRSQEGAVANARAASTELSRARVEREEVEHYVRARRAGRALHAGTVRPA